MIRLKLTFGPTLGTRYLNLVTRRRTRRSRDLIYTVVSINVIKLEYENDYENRKRIRAQLRLLNKKKNDERGK